MFVCIFRVFICLFASAALPLSAATTLDPMVALFHKWQMKDAAVMVEKAAEGGHKHVQFCIALQAQLDQQHRVKAIGLYRENRDPAVAGNVFYPSDSEVISEIKNYYATCFSKAVEKKLAISLLLHLNAHGEIQEWRNHYDFDPLLPLSGMTYEQSMLIPLIETLESSVPSDWPVEISLQGEMGTTVFKYPQSWRTLIERIRTRGKLTNARFGLSFNYQGVAGSASPAEIDTAAVKKLWDACDFIGVSMYQAVSLPPIPEDFDLAVGLFAGEFMGLRCPLPGNKPIDFVEVGLGGGGLSSVDWKTSVPATHVADAARAPYLGSPKYLEANPWSDPTLRTLRVNYHSALCHFLSASRQRHSVRRAFLWSFGSWDPHGLSEENFADKKIIQSINEHNRKVR
jgi:hypothetical protein